VGDGDDPLRLQLAALRVLLARAGIAVVLVTGLDRLAADPIAVERLRAEWARAGVALLVAGPPAGR
jgi:hypothetical protein